MIGFFNNPDAGAGIRQERKDQSTHSRQDKENFERTGNKLNDSGPLLDGGGTSGRALSQLQPENFGGSPTSNNEADYMPPLLAGERVEGVYKDMTYLCPYSVPSALKGTLVLTNYRIYFKSDTHELSTSSSGSPLQPPPLVLDVPLGFVSNVAKMGGQNRPGDEHAYGLEIVCKDIRSLRFAMSKKFQENSAFTSHGMNPKGATSRSDIYQTLRRFCFPNTNHIPMFAYEFNENYPPFNADGVRGVSGWKLYDPVRVKT